jgi:hypothetical protein
MDKAIPKRVLLETDAYKVPDEFKTQRREVHTYGSTVVDAAAKRAGYSEVPASPLPGWRVGELERSIESGGKASGKKGGQGSLRK